MKFLKIVYWASLAAFGIKAFLMLHWMTVFIPGAYIHIPERLFDALVTSDHYLIVFVMLSFGFIFWIFKEKQWIIWMNYSFIPFLVYSLWGSRYAINEAYAFIVLSLLRYVSWYFVKAKPIKGSASRLATICIIVYIISSIASYVYQHTHRYIYHSIGFYAEVVSYLYSIFFIKSAINWISEEKQIADDITSIQPAV